MILVSCDPALRRMGFVPAPDPEEAPDESARVRRRPRFPAGARPVASSGPRPSSSAAASPPGSRTTPSPAASPRPSSASWRPGPVDVRWGDPFEVRTESGALLGRGRCLYPGAPPAGRAQGLETQGPPRPSRARGEGHGPGPGRARRASRA
ncbi:MAG: hypothetical protein MZU79_04845 [Anaerotruncus sp.]|nr:hypothetical protein [Anaerotruncus sp.]